jgi:protein-S-isoprenylcysteine O-methyltransferase Ste14
MEEMMLFDQALWRFATSGTLILLYGVAEGLARRSGAGPDRPGVPAPRWLKPASFAALGGFYLLIAPTGGALAGGWANGVGVVLALAAMGFRLAAGRGIARLRHPTTAARMAFYAALPLAVGVPWGWLALTAPALVMSAHCSLREDRILAERLGTPYAELMARTHRWVPGMW